MKQHISKLSAALVLLSVALGAPGCFGDPEGPGAAGSISLGAGVTAGDFTTLRVRAVPDDGKKAFDPKAPAFPGAVTAEESSWSPGTEQVAGMTFPHGYQIGAALGTTDHESFRLFVWLSKSPAETDEAAPTSGEPYGTTMFKVAGCGAYGGFCTVTKGVDVAIDKTAP